MARQEQTKMRWTTNEDNKLKEVKLKDPNLPWPDIAKQAKLNRTAKSCWERWENNLNPDINKGEFSQEEDDIIIQQMSLPQNSWASIAKYHLRGRAANAIKNRWNNHLKKRHATISDLRRRLLYLVEHLMDDETSDHSLPGDDLETLMAEFASLIPNVDLNGTTDHSVRGDGPETWMAELDSLITNVDPNATSWDDETSDHSVWGDDHEALMTWFASLIPNLERDAIRSFPGYNS